MDKEKLFYNCWNDPERMRSLFADFRSKSLNPHGWDTKMSFWKQTVTEYCRLRKQIRFSEEELCKSLEWKGSNPQCLPTVLNEMSREKTITTVEEFQSQVTNRGWVAWGFNVLLKQPIGWGWSLVRNSVFGPPPACSHRYINTLVLKEICASVLERIQAKEENTTIPCSSLHNECKDICPDFDDFLCVIHQLEMEGKLAIFIQDSQKLIKIISKMNTPVSLTETDLGVIRLEKAQQTVEREIGKLREEIDRCRQEALVAVKNGLKKKAEVALAKKQRMEKQLDKKIDTLENIEKMREQLLQSDSNRKIFDAYQSGAKALKSTVKNDFNIDKLDDTMAEIEDALETHSEIQATLSKTVGVEEDLELESELDQLLQEESESEGLSQDISSLNLNKSVEIAFPKVPQVSPQKEEKDRHLLVQ